MKGHAGSNSPSKAESFGEPGRAWWLLCRPSPKVMSALADERLVEQEHVQRDDKGYDHRGHRRSDPVVY
jgi:hypothetical protein